LNSDYFRGWAQKKTVAFFDNGPVFFKIFDRITSYPPSFRHAEGIHRSQATEASTVHGRQKIHTARKSLRIPPFASLPSKLPSMIVGQKIKSHFTAHVIIMIVSMRKAMAKSQRRRLKINSKKLKHLHYSHFPVHPQQVYSLKPAWRSYLWPDPNPFCISPALKNWGNQTGKTIRLANAFGTCSFHIIPVAMKHPRSSIAARIRISMSWITDSPHFSPRLKCIIKISYWPTTSSWPNRYLSWSCYLVSQQVCFLTVSISAAYWGLVKNRWTNLGGFCTGGNSLRKKSTC